MTNQKVGVIGDYVEAISSSSDAGKVFGVVTQHEGDVLLVLKFDEKTPVSCQLVLEVFSLRDITDPRKLHKILDIRQKLGFED